MATQTTEGAGHAPTLTIDAAVEQPAPPPGPAVPPSARPQAPVRLVHVTTVPMTLAFVTGQVTDMRRRGFDVFAVSSPGEDLDAFRQQEGTPVFGVPMARQITPVRDLQALGRIYRYFRRMRPQIVHAHTPKGGLLGTIAAWLARVPIRIYHIHGLPLMTASGRRRSLLRWTEWLSCRLATTVLCVSQSVRVVAIAEGLCRPGKIAVLLNGSVNGVDAAGRFDPARWRGQRHEVRERYGIPVNARVIGFVGRVVVDKGIADLQQAWRQLREEFPDLHLLMVGFFEPHDPLPAEVVADLTYDPRVHVTGRQAHTPPFYAAMDMVVLPSYREGFPVVPLEAAAMALPVVATQVPGCNEAVLDGLTGALVPPKDPAALAAAIRRYLMDDRLRASHGAAARARTLDRFRPEALWEAQYAEYRRLLDVHV